MTDKLKLLLGAINTWLVVTAAVLAIVVDELAPFSGAHPVIEWTVRVAGVAIVALGVASRILARSTEVPPGLQGLNPDHDVVSSQWSAWDGGEFRYTAPRQSPQSPQSPQLAPDQGYPDAAA